MGKKLPKRDRFGIHLKMENACLDCLTLSIEAALAPTSEKHPILKKLQVNVEILKHLVRTSQELGIISVKTYFTLVPKLHEISKMTAGWKSYIAKKELQ